VTLSDREIVPDVTDIVLKFLEILLPLLLQPKLNIPPNILYGIEIWALWGPR